MVREESSPTARAATAEVSITILYRVLLAFFVDILLVPDTKPVFERKGFFGVFEYSSPLFFGNPVLALRDHTLRDHNACTNLYAIELLR